MQLYEKHINTETIENIKETKSNNLKTCGFTFSYLNFKIDW